MQYISDEVTSENEVSWVSSNGFYFFPKTSFKVNVQMLFHTLARAETIPRYLDCELWYVMVTFLAGTPL